MKHKARLDARLALIAIFILAALCCQNTATAIAAAAGQAAAAGTRQEAIVDPAYGMTAFTLAVPAGWKFAGTILRPGGCHPPPIPAAGLSFTELSPDGKSEKAQLPGVSWTWTSNGTNLLGPKCPSNVDINSASGLLLNIGVPNRHPDAKKVTLVPLPQNLQNAIAAENQKLAAGLQAHGLRGSRHFQDAGLAKIEYVSGGQPMEEEDFTVIDCTESPGLPMPMVGGGMRSGYTTRRCFSRGTTIFRAPAGEVGKLMHSMISNIAQINPAWDQRVVQDMSRAFQQMQAASDAAFKQNMAHFKAEHDAQMASGRAVQQNLQNSTDRAIAQDRSRQAAIDDSAHRTALYSLDQEEFRNPSTGEVVRASNQYSHQWMSSDGSTLIQTDNHNLDPNGQVYPISQSWTELVPR